ncbi:thioredoxin-dependent thiol peroxidase [Frigidibacter sp. ROC022]|uniref:thioredoxin-dependent thiol peroxidase n=1 Tax=Frigidibacter sp. ROC022 TaxID=2971796 RepID=UPI00215A5D28|nr:thioredoxin-dependent thiol peroxidase [Frigidibacter sp. ROC022]MCR8723557.1 thioredoxin-dependent thiol peroxidase [Frigidibacter sp. ROC022]
MIQPGDTAPDFTLPATPDTTVTLSELRPSRVVLFFYPKDMTPGCTDEAIGFSAAEADFAKAGVRIVGVSKDSLKRHQNFIAKHPVSVPLASDAESDTCERYGVWGEKKMMGRSYLGIIRSTFLIGPDGTVEKVWSPVRVKGHVAEVLAAVTG